MAEEWWVENNERGQECLNEGFGDEDQRERVSVEIRDRKYGRAVGLQLRPLYHKYGRAAGDLEGMKVRVRRRIAVCPVWPMHQNHARNV